MVFRVEFDGRNSGLRSEIQGLGVQTHQRHPREKRSAHCVKGWPNSWYGIDEDAIDFNFWRLHKCAEKYCQTK